MNSKLFDKANGRLFRIQAVVRSTGKHHIMRDQMTRQQVEQFEPTRADKQYLRYFRVAFATPQN